MDAKQISMLCTTNQSVYMAERAKGDYFESDNNPDAAPPIVKEPEVPFVASGTYPIVSLLPFFKLAKTSKATHMKIELARQDRPLRLEFESGDSLNFENGVPKNEMTWLYCAPRIRNDDDEMPKEKILEQIALHEKEIEILRLRLPKEEKAL